MIVTFVCDCCVYVLYVYVFFVSLFLYQNSASASKQKNEAQMIGIFKIIIKTFHPHRATHKRS